MCEAPEKPSESSCEDSYREETRPRVNVLGDNLDRKNPPANLTIGYEDWSVHFFQLITNCIRLSYEQHSFSRKKSSQSHIIDFHTTEVIISFKNLNQNFMINIRT